MEGRRTEFDKFMEGLASLYAIVMCIIIFTIAGIAFLFWVAWNIFRVKGGETQLRQPHGGAEKEPYDEERERTLEWPALYGQSIADAMFRDAGLFYEEELRDGEDKKSTPPSV
ncbi:MAG: hypothetical protein HY001_01965 [Candidatus Portnoybacteria bacterium]|nr:hypothetical protein [Candidatus Portnoybacteria bacterium]